MSCRAMAESEHAAGGEGLISVQTMNTKGKQGEQAQSE